MVSEIILKFGNISDSDKLWFAYKYKTVSDEQLTDKFFNTYIQLSFNEHFLNRMVNHMIYDNFDNIVTTQIMKFQNNECPLTEATKSILGCTCPKTNICSGFCTFPVNRRGKNNLQNKHIRDSFWFI
jgi:hypothetical protein